MPNHDESLPRWQGKVDAHMESVPKQLDILFKAVDVAEKATKLVEDKLNKKVDSAIIKLSEDVQQQGTKLSNLTARLSVIVAIGSFVGTVVTSLFVAAIIKIFLK